MKLSDIGEQGLLKIIQAFCPPEIIGDDGAVLNITPGTSLVVTTDVLVDGVHFSDGTTKPEDAGWRAVAANLSDLAAMGSTPVGITVGLGLPGEVEISWVERLYEGMGECLRQYSTYLVGGDVVRSPLKTISITALGEVAPHQAIYRHTAQVGDAIVVTGIHGASRAGLELLLHPDQTTNLEASTREKLISAHQRPQPRLDVIPVLQNLFLDNPTKFPVSGMDSSDGLADAICQICRASQVGAIINAQQIPVPDILPSNNTPAWLTPSQTLEYALYGGEDFELVLCLPNPAAKNLIAQIGGSAAIIGEITDDAQVFLNSPNKQIPSQVLTLNRGFQHF